LQAASRFTSELRGGRRHVRDAVTIVRQMIAEAALELAVRRDVVGIDAQVLVPLVAALEDQVGDLGGLVVAQRQAIDVDRLVLPLTGEPELSPSAEILLRPARPLWPPAGAVPTAQPLRTEDAIELLHGEVREGVVLVHDDAVAGLPAGDVVGTRRQLDLDGRAVLVAL